MNRKQLTLVLFMLSISFVFSQQQIDWQEVPNSDITVFLQQQNLVKTNDGLWFSLKNSIEIKNHPHCNHDNYSTPSQQGLFYSKNYGKTWSHCDTSEKTIVAIAADSEKQLLIKTEQGKVFRGVTVKIAEPGSQVEFLTMKPTNSKKNSKWGEVLTDIKNHEVDHNNYNDLVTLAHETSHGIHAWIRNNMNKTGKRANGFYVLKNRVVVVIEPSIRKKQVGPYVPPSLRESRYYTYVVGQPAWDDTPLYIWDEWNAYVNGADAGVDLVKNGLWKYGWRDAVMGELEFVVYAIATAMAVQDLDPDYFANHRQFREFLAWNIKRSMKSYLEGSKMEHFKWDKQDKYYEKLKTSPDAEKLRQFCREMFGASWTKKVLGF